MSTHRTTVHVSITPEVREALRLLERHERTREESLNHVKAKLERGAAQAKRGELLDGGQVFDELQEMIEDRRLAKASNS